MHPSPRCVATQTRYEIRIRSPRKLIPDTKSLKRIGSAPSNLRRVLPLDLRQGRVQNIYHVVHDLSGDGQWRRKDDGVPGAGGQPVAPDYFGKPLGELTL